jgi:hypothetical protein
VLTVVCDGDPHMLVTAYVWGDLPAAVQRALESSLPQGALTCWLLAYQCQLLTMLLGTREPV